MINYSTVIKNKLNSIIRQMAISSDLFVKNPGKDFTRNRKMTFESVINILLSMGEYYL